jgi:hypothetical protein
MQLCGLTKSFAHTTLRVHHLMFYLLSSKIHTAATRAHPRGCTAFCQPVDIRINKPFKNRLCNQCEDWIIEEGLANGTTSLPRRFDIVRWTRYAVANLSRQTLKVLVGGTVITPGFHQPESNNKQQIWMPITTLLRIVIRNTVIYYD